MVQHADIDHTGITGAGGSVATDSIWDAAGDLAVGSGANTAAKLTKGSDGDVLTVTAGAVGWAAPAGGGGVAPWFLAPDGGVAPFDATGISVGTANLAYYYPATLQAAATITGIGFHVRTSSGNVNVGLYDSSGNRVAVSGSTACPAAGIRSVDFSAPYAAAAGRYYLAFVCDNTTAIFLATTSGVANAQPPWNARTEASAFSLPATASFTDTGARYFAIIGRISGGYP